MPRSFWYCLTTAFLGLVRISTRAEASRSSSTPATVGDLILIVADKGSVVAQSLSNLQDVEFRLRRALENAHLHATLTGLH